MTRTVEDLYPSTTNKEQALYKRTLLMPAHTAAASAHVSIAHAQLRHLISCPQRRGTVYYVNRKSIIERDLLNPSSPPRCIVDMDFLPTCFAATAVGSNPNTILFAAGGYASDLHLSLHSFPPSTQSSSPSRTPSPASPKLVWRHAFRLRGKPEIVNSILFTPAALTDDTRRSSSELRMAVSGNDAAVKFFEVGLQPNLSDDKRVQECGSISLDTPINHMSISPDGRTLLCVGDTPNAYLFDICPGSTTTFSPLATYVLPRPAPHRPSSPILPPSSTTPPMDFRSLACFTTAWSVDGLKFAVASQEGQLCVWDVRSAKPLFTFWTAYRRNSTVSSARSRLGEWEWEDLGGPMRFHDDGTNNGPDSGIRNVRFSGGEGGRELLVFTEHTTNLHVMDARTFDLASHSVIPFPDLSYLLPSSPEPPIPTIRPPRTPSPPTIVRESPPTNNARAPAGLIMAGRPRIISRSRSGSPPAYPHPAIIRPPRSRSRSRSPTRSPSVIIVPPPPAQPLPIPGLPDERGLFWPPSRGERSPPESRARLDADGDVVEGGDGEGMAGHVVVLDRSDGMGWPRRVQRHMMPPVPLGVREPAIAPPLESVAEGGEPPQPQRPAHIAGMCLDPSGGWVYVASESGIVEWRVREREEGKTCWGSGAWA